MLTRPAEIILNSNINTNSDIFKYKELTPIITKLDVDSLSIIFQQLKKNIQHLPTTLEDGILKYLFILGFKDNHP